VETVNQWWSVSGVVSVLWTWSERGKENWGNNHIHAHAQGPPPHCSPHWHGHLWQWRLHSNRRKMLDIQENIRKGSNLVLGSLKLSSKGTSWGLHKYWKSVVPSERNLLTPLCTKSAYASWSIVVAVYLFSLPIFVFPSSVEEPMQNAEDIYCDRHFSTMSSCDAMQRKVHRLTWECVIQNSSQLERNERKGNVDISGRWRTNSRLDGILIIPIYGELTRQRHVWLA
jgi:hypothetical protein